MRDDDVRMLRELAVARIDDDQLHALPSDRTLENGCGDGEAPARVDADDQRNVRVLDLGVRSRCGPGAELVDESND